MQLLGAAIPVIALACVAAPVVAQNASPNLAGIAHVAIRVSDLERSRAFFHKLGFEEAFAMSKSGSPTEAFFKVNNRQFIELYPRHSLGEAVGFMHICFEATDIDAVYQDYVEHGLAPSPVKRAGAGNLLFTLQGPDEPGQASDLRPAVTQNIEYTQYMPGSRHTLDRGQHLGPDRLAEQIAGVGLPITDPATAAKFYIEKLGFQPADHSLEPAIAALVPPGSPDQRIEFLTEPVSSTGADTSLPFHLIFSVPNLRHTSERLRVLGLSVKKYKSSLTIEDPDGNGIVFIEDAGPGRAESSLTSAPRLQPSQN
jgi:catechol 2,3-dioxygenase-like lactoylglutathione lyase family enzyme